MNIIKCVCTLVFLLQLNCGKSQLYYVNYGYNATNTNLNGINNIVNNYNDTRPWLSNEMKPFAYLDGIDLSIGFIVSNFWTELGFDFRSQKRSASGEDLFDNYNTRQLKVKNGSGRITLGAMIGDEVLSGGLGIRGEFGELKTKTRVFGDSFEKGDFEAIGEKQYAFRFGPSLKLLTIVPDPGIDIAITMYYLWSPSTINFTSVDESLNNINYEEMQTEFDVRPNVFGLSIEVGLAGN